MIFKNVFREARGVRPDKFQAALSSFLSNKKNIPKIYNDVIDLNISILHYLL